MSGCLAVLAPAEVPVAVVDDTVALCRRWAQGDAAALETMFDRTYDHLMVIAVRKLEHERRLSYFSPACLLGETFIRFRRQRPFYFSSEAHFCNIAARQMSQVLIDQIREYLAAKRGGPERDDMCSLCEEIYSFGEAGRVIDRLHLALRELGRLAPRQAELIALRFFCGCTIEEAAASMNISVSTLKREWSEARAWLVRQIRHG